MIKVLHYIPGFSYGGIENVVLSLYENVDKTKIQFDFLVECDIPEYAEKIIYKNGGKIIKIPKMTKPTQFIKHIRSARKVFKNNSYDVFHCHSLDTRPFPMFFSKRFKTKVRIMHIHFNDFNDKKFLFIKKCLIRFGQRNANYYIACSKRASTSIFTKKNSEKALILNNGINTDIYKFNENMRNKIRKDLCGKKTFLIGCIGRLSYLKNQQFILSFINKLNEDNLIIFLGDGEDRETLISYANKNNINNVRFLGNVNNVEEYLNAFDLVLVPSKSEAMPLIILELQANGIPAIVSSAIDDEFIINENIHKLELEEQKWIDDIVLNKFERVKPNKKIKNFDIKTTTSLYEKLLYELMKK